MSHPSRLVMEFHTFDKPIALFQTGSDDFMLIHGDVVQEHLDYSLAAHLLGDTLFRALVGAGRIA